jgi:hypothetical protein
VWEIVFGEVCEREDVLQKGDEVITLQEDVELEAVVFRCVLVEESLSYMASR